MENRREKYEKKIDLVATSKHGQQNNEFAIVDQENDKNENEKNDLVVVLKHREEYNEFASRVKLNKFETEDVHTPRLSN